MDAKKIAWVLLAVALMPVMPASLAWSAEPAEPEPAAAMPTPMARPALLPGTENLASQLMPAAGEARGLDGYQWLDVTKQQGLLVHRAAFQVPAKGVGLMVSADVGAHSGGSLVGQLRRALPANSWHSYLVGLPLRSSELTEPSDQVLAARVTQAFELVQAAHPDASIVVFGEGSVCDALATLFAPDGSLAAAGLVLLNQPPPVVAGGPLSTLQVPTLLLQILPNRYPVGYPLAQAVDLRQLPRVSPRQPKSLVVRQVQGWMRQFEEPQGPLD